LSNSIGGLCALDGEKKEKESFYDSKKTGRSYGFAWGIIRNILIASFLLFFNWWFRFVLVRMIFKDKFSFW
jgi:hypothetical protein